MLLVRLEFRLILPYRLLPGFLIEFLLTCFRFKQCNFSISSIFHCRLHVSNFAALALNPSFFQRHLLQAQEPWPIEEKAPVTFVASSLITFIEPSRSSYQPFLKPRIILSQSTPSIVDFSLNRSVIFCQPCLKSSPSKFTQQLPNQ